MEKRLRNTYRKIATKPELKQAAKILRTQLFNKELKEAQGAKVRSRWHFELDGEKYTKFFFKQMEKRTNAKQDMLSITTVKDGKVVTDQTDILNKVKNFYANLYPKNLRLLRT